MEFLQTLLPSPEAGLAGLFLVSFLAASVLPIGSEPFFLALLALRPEQATVAVTCATVGNTLGGLGTYALARYFPHRQPHLPARLETLRRYGSPALVLAWVPLIGDVLCAAAGWLRLPWLACTLWMAVGKGARYALLAWGMRFL